MALDIVISFDTTGSMYPCLSEVRRRAVDFVRTVYDTYYDTFEDVRIGIIAHGDYCDGPNTLNLLSFRDKADTSSVLQFIQDAPKTSGGDTPECYELVLHAALHRFKWKADNRILILIADAPPHTTKDIDNPYSGIKSHNGGKLLNWIQEADALVASGVRIYPVQCLRYRNIADYFYDYLAKISNVPKLELDQFSSIIQLLTAVIFRQVSEDKLIRYGEYLQTTGGFNRNISDVLNLLLNADKFVGGIEFDNAFNTVFTVPEPCSLDAVHPARFQVLHVDTVCNIQDFVESTGAVFRKGKGFYQLTKPELVQEKKEVILRNAVGDMFSGAKAREMINLPYGKRGKVGKGDIPSGYDVFIQSTSYTRKLLPKTQFLYEVPDYAESCE